MFRRFLSLCWRNQLLHHFCFCLSCWKVFLEFGFTFHKINKCACPFSRTAKVAAGQEKHLLFEVQPGSDSSAFWKVVVRVVCTKVRLVRLLFQSHAVWVVKGT